ncbi:c-type cytochrome biogenesis protein CcmI [Thalassotalea sp. HSM 43]|uniref:c-type cytochrome biogenesis protein CcmI n=1 Tax=Thalassotalea sp. HSM 43 TaxID=2552945 RepID=UPI0010804689|nr:c-type cytochrome biogenesis protein CcmI [Thalassotalea sp. HSM 43]QBY04893.1 c-type cytochrome biogenesis protein CcmI [Thalassotalea sp. HSM 43]
MTTFYIFAVLLLLLAILFIWRHFFQRRLYQADQSNMRGQTNKDLYYEHLAELEKDLQEGGIDQENFEFLKQELDRSLVLDMNASDKEAEAKDKKTSFVWPAIMTVFVVAYSVVMYVQYGAHEQVELAQSMPTDHPQGEQSQAQMIIAQLQTLHKEVQDNPDNSNAWFQLGQILTNVGEFDSAFVAFGKVNEIEGEQADILALQAQSIYYKNNRQRNEQVDNLLAKALTLDPNDATTLMLIGMDHFLNNRFTQASQSWQQILDSGNAGSNAPALMEAIKEANMRAEGAPVTGMAEESATMNSENTERSANTGADVAAIALSVSMSDEIMSLMADQADKTVFIYAVASNGPRMPLAAVKVRASDLPYAVTLDDSMSMNGQMTLSMVEQVDVFAVISQSGTPGIKAGDYKGEAKQINVKGAEPLNLIIDSVVK